MVRRIYNIITILALTIFVIGVLGNEVYAAGSFSVSASSTSITVGSTTKVTINAKSCAGGFSISSSDTSVATVSSTQEFLDSNSVSITVKGLKAGKATISVKAFDVSDYDENTVTGTKTVTITVKEKTTSSTNTGTTTATKSSNANISKLTLNIEGFKFNSKDTTYNVNVGEDVDNISVGVSLEHSKATYTVSGNKNLKVGNNVITIAVTAENGTKKTYKINVNKKGNVEETSADLSNLIIENMTFDTPFDVAITEYNGNEMKYVEKLNIFPYTVADEATYEIIGNENFKEGENTVVVKVTSKDETNTKEYKVTFEMLAKEESNALQPVNIYTEENETKGNDSNNGINKVINGIKENLTVIMLSVLAFVEFIVIICLSVKINKYKKLAYKKETRRNV